jgi:4-amino-4-deoxy-L-arabinose transferase-like glycosyltransferase
MTTAAALESSSTTPRVRARDASVVLIVALAVRLAVVAWAAARIPPAADGRYYHTIAQRIAGGLGYTWLWDDGAVTYAAHYPVGYPALVGALYAIGGAHPALAMMLNAVFGVLGALAVHSLAARSGSRRAALVAGLVVALHPGLVAYTPALMTEGVTGALVACIAWLAAGLRDAIDGAERRRTVAALIGLGALVGGATLVRPQVLVLAPLFAGIAALGSRREGVTRAAVRRVALCASAATAIAVAVCSPWTLRNCARMHRCALVSVNAGWNLLIGADDAANGAWAHVRVPDACAEVWGEAEKDACFEHEALRAIGERPGRWLRLVPAKLAATFDYCGAAGWYLREANGEVFGDRAKVVLGAVETVYERVVLLFALLWAARSGRGRGTRALSIAFAMVGAVSAVLVHAWVGYLAFVAAALMSPSRLVRGSALGWTAATAVLSLAATHAVFFGAGRYGLIAFPLLTGIAGLAWPGMGPDRDDGRRGFDKVGPDRAMLAREERTRCP